jgi:CheY-like chemotaxis protein
MTTPFRILLVEDNEGDVDLTQRAVLKGDTPCTIEVANDGAEALAVLRRSGRFSNAVTPQVILLDLNMPGMDGKKFLETVKADVQLKAIPVVIVTSSQSPTDVADCYERQASCYVVKPFDGTEYTETIKQIVGFWTKYVQLPRSIGAL